MNICDSKGVRTSKTDLTTFQVSKTLPYGPPSKWPSPVHNLPRWDTNCSLLTLKAFVKLMGDFLDYEEGSSYVFFL